LKKGLIMKNYVFKVVIEDDQFPDGKKAYSAYCPVLKGCNTWGYTYEEALANIREAIEGHIECLLAQGEPIPADDIEQEDISPAIFDAKLRVKA
jgi:predicted RNase H-like HicB family nuclease